MRQFERRSVLAMLAAAGALPPGIASAAETRVLQAGIALENNRVEIAVGMDGHGPYTFMIDTGTYVSAIRPDLAKELALPVQGYERSQGVGGKSQAFHLYLARNFVIGGGIRQKAVVLEDAFDFGYHADLYGTLAAGILTAADTDLDFDAGELRIYPDGRGDRTGYTLLDSEIPRADAKRRGSRKINAGLTLNGQPIRCVLDTGSPGMLMLHRRVARRMGLWDDSRPYAPSRPNGIGGAGPMARVIRVDSLTMGSARVNHPLITLLDVDMDNDLDGIVGLSLLRQFNMSIDTHGRKLWVKPSRYPPLPGNYGLGGVWIDRDGDRIKVEAVGTGSPAAAAGIRAGDFVTGIAFEAAIRQLSAGAGATVTWTILRDGASLPVTFTLAPYL